MENTLPEQCCPDTGSETEAAGNAGADGTNAGRTDGKDTDHTGIRERTTAASDLIRMAEQAEKDAAYARSHMKIKEVEVERKVLYEKCKNCKQSLLDKAIAFYDTLHNNYDTDCFSAGGILERHSGFLYLFLNRCGEVVGIMLVAECGLAELISGIIRQPIWSNVVYWIALALLLILTGILLFFICHKVWDKYRKKIRSGINMWTVSAAMLLLMVVVYLGDYIRLIFPINLLLIWLISVCVLLAVGLYVVECNKYRY